MAWPFGKKHSEETKAKLRAALAGRAKSEAHKTAISNAQRGKKRGRYRRREEVEEEG